MSYFQYFGAGITMILGFMGFFFPKKAAEFTSLSWKSPEGFSEFRSTFGGLFIGLGAYPLLDGTYHSFFMIGFAWLATGIGRVISIFSDQCFTRKNWIAVVFEMSIGITMLSGHIEVWKRWFGEWVN